MNDVYQEPELFNLEIFDELEDEPDYNFNKFVIWKHKETNKLFYATDSGCSCPSPFQNFNFISELTPITLENLDNFIKELHDWYDSLGDGKPKITELLEVESKVRMFVEESK